MDFFRSLPKTELHAHLSGSISPSTLHAIWESKKVDNKDLDLPDPLIALRQPDGKHHNIATFFPLFDKYIYSLVDDVESVKEATKGVIDAFRDDGVVYLELRTTPRVLGGGGAGGKEGYVRAVSEAIGEYDQLQQREEGAGRPVIMVRLILSIDRRMSLEQAMEVVDLAARYRYHRDNKEVDEKLREASVTTPATRSYAKGFVVAIDLCGNPAYAPAEGISLLTPAFTYARTQHDLPITVHFAEVPQSSTTSELTTLLSWQPARLGHVIHVRDDPLRSIIRDRKLALELCLSCNVLAEMTAGGYGGHHLREWMGGACPIALSTDDIAVFASPLSNEYRLATQHFDLSRDQILTLAESAAGAAFDQDGRDYVLSLLRKFCATQQKL